MDAFVFQYFLQIDSSLIIFVLSNINFHLADPLVVIEIERGQYLLNH